MPNFLAACLCPCFAVMNLSGCPAVQPPCHASCNFMQRLDSGFQARHEAVYYEGWVSCGAGSTSKTVNLLPFHFDMNAKPLSLRCMLCIACPEFAHLDSKPQCQNKMSLHDVRTGTTTLLPSSLWDASRLISGNSKSCCKQICFCCRWSWCLPCGFGSIVPYFYVIYFAVLLGKQSYMQTSHCLLAHEFSIAWWHPCVCHHTILRPPLSVYCLQYIVS